MKTIHYIVGAALLMLTSCGAPKGIEYFQDVENGTSIKLQESSIIKVQPNDKLTIAVGSLTPELAMPLNLPYVSTRIGQGSSATSSINVNNQNGVLLYSVDDEGYVEMPQLGKIHVAGMTRSQVADVVKKTIIAQGVLSDPTVVVEFANLAISVLGEVSKPGRYAIDRDMFTIYDAIGAAGDLTIYGKRDAVKVMRVENGEQKVYTVDLCNAASVAQSPVYCLRQGDMVYVAPNNMRARQSTVNGNNVLSTSFWISLASLLTTVCVLVFK